MKAAQVTAAAFGALLALTACDDQPAATPKPPDLSSFVPQREHRDPSKSIPGITVRDYTFGVHVRSPQRVAYDASPPFGGAHDIVWAGCNGQVYAKAVRNENMVHTLEHGAVWITYDPARVGGDDLAALTAKVTGQTYISLSPYPGLDRPFSLQSWGHQLKLDDVHDPRVDQFLTALRANRYTTPEPGGPCDPSPYFDVADPPPFDPSPPGPDAVPVNGPASVPKSTTTSTPTSTK